MCAAANLYHRDDDLTVNEISDPVFVLFVVVAFLGMNEVSLFYSILSLRSLWGLKVFAWALLQTKGDSSQKPVQE